MLYGTGKMFEKNIQSTTIPSGNIILECSNTKISSGTHSNLRLCSRKIHEPKKCQDKYLLSI